MIFKFREYLEENGYDTSAMGLPGEDTTAVIEDAPIDEKNEKSSEEA